MMNTKKLVILAAILAAAVSIILVINMLSNRTLSEESLQFFTGISEKTIGAVLLKDPTDTVKLQRKGDVWVMIPKQVISLSTPSQDKKASGLSRAMGADTGIPVAPAAKPPAGLIAAEFPADSATMAQLMENTVKIKKNILVSENPAKQVTFEVDAGHGTRVEVFDIAGRSRGAVIIGKAGTDYNCYFRPEGSTTVFLAQNVSRWTFGADHKRWPDRSIMKFDKAMVKQMTIAKKGAPTIVIARGDTAHKGWLLLEPAAGKPQGTLDSNKVNELLGSLSNFMAAEYEDSAYTDSATGLAEPSMTIMINFMSGTVRTLAFGNKKQGANKFWVRVPEKQFLYLVNEYDYTRCDKKPQDFMQQAAKPPVPTAAARGKAKPPVLSKKKDKK